MSVKPLRECGPAARIAVIAGDGIGKEVTPESVKAIRSAITSARRQIEFVEFDWGADKFLREGVSLPAEHSAIRAFPRISTPQTFFSGCVSSLISL